MLLHGEDEHQQQKRNVIDATGWVVRPSAGTIERISLKTRFQVVSVTKPNRTDVVLLDEAGIIKRSCLLKHAFGSHILTMLQNGIAPMSCLWMPSATRISMCCGRSAVWPARARTSATAGGVSINTHFLHNTSGVRCAPISGYNCRMMRPLGRLACTRAHVSNRRWGRDKRPLSS